MIVAFVHVNPAVSTTPILAYHDFPTARRKNAHPNTPQYRRRIRAVPAGGGLNATAATACGARIKGATVFMPKTNGKPRKTTDGNGFVSISPVKPVESTHVVEVSAPGYQVFTYNIYFKARLTAFHSFCLRTLASQPTRTPTTVVEETQSGLQIIFAVKEKQFRNLAVSGKNQRGKIPPGKHSSDSYPLRRNRPRISSGCTHHAQLRVGGQGARTAWRITWWY